MSALSLAEAAPAPPLLRRWAPALFVLPLCLALGFAFVWPLLESVVNSFHPFTRAGIDTSTWTLANYTKLADSYYLGILLRTVRVSLTVTFITALHKRLNVDVPESDYPKLVTRAGAIAYLAARVR